MIFSIVNFFSVLAILIIYLQIYFFDKKVSKQLVDIKLISMTTFLVSLSFLIDKTFVILFSWLPIKTTQVRAGNVILALIGFLCGGMLGLLGGIAADFLRLLSGIQGQFSFYFTLGSVIKAIMPFYFTCFFVKFFYHKKMINFYLFFSFVIVYSCISLVLNPIYFYYVIYNKNCSWTIIYAERLSIFLPVVVISSSLFVIICRRLTKYIQPNIELFDKTEHFNVRQ